MSDCAWRAGLQRGDARGNRAFVLPVHEAVLGGVERGGGAGLDADLLVDVLDVVADRLGRDVKLAGDEAVQAPAGGQREDLRLPLAEAIRPRGDGCGVAAAERGEQRADDLTVEAARRRLGGEDARGLLVGVACTMRARLT